MKNRNLLNKKITQWLLLGVMLVGCSVNSLAYDKNADVYLLGSLTINGVTPGWDDNDACKLTKVSNSTLMYIEGNINNEDAKIREKGGWSWSYGSGGDNIKLGSGNKTIIARHVESCHSSCTLMSLDQSKKFVGKTYYIDCRNFTDYKDNCVLKSYVYIDSNCSDDYYLESASISETSTNNVYKATFTTDAPVYSIKLARNVNSTDYNLIKLNDWSSSYNCIKVTDWNSGEKSYFSDCTDPVVTDFTYTSSADYTGSGISANVAWKSGTGSGAITTYYEGTSGTSYTKSITPPTNAGNYNISINVEAGGSYCEKKDLSLGTMTINKINQSTLSITTSTEARCVSASPLTLETSGGSGSGAITYKIISGGTGTGSISGSKLTVTKSGTIKVQAEKAADTNYNKATSAIVTFTFNGTVVTTSPALDNIHPYEVVTLTADKESVTWDIADVPAGVVKDKNAYFPWGNTGKSVTFKGALGNGYHLTATADGCVTNIEFNVILDSEDCH